MLTSWTLDQETFRFGTRNDIEAIATMLSDPEVGRYLWFTPIEPEGVAEYFGPFFDNQKQVLERGESPPTAVFTVFDGDGAFLGQGAVVEVAGSPGGYEIGFQLPRAAWGRGVGTRLARFLCSYAVCVLDAFRIEASCLEGNAGSRRLLEKMGLELEGRKVDYRLKEGVRHSELIYGARVEALDLEAIRGFAAQVGLSGG